MAQISKAYFWGIMGVLVGILVVSVLRNGEINWVLMSAVTAISVLAFFATLLIRYEIKKNSY